MPCLRTSHGLRKKIKLLEPNGNERRLPPTTTICRDAYYQGARGYANRCKSTTVIIHENHNIFGKFH